MTSAATALAPHPRSMLSFGCRVLAAVERAEVEFAPTDITPEALPPMSPWEAACLADANYRYAGELVCYKADELSLASGHGLKLSPALRAYCDEKAERRLRMVSTLKRRQESSPRELEVRMMLGSMMLQRGGRGASAAACRMLNQGIPTMAAKGGRQSGFVRPSNIRHARNTITRTKLELSRGRNCAAMLWQMKFQAGAAIHLWDRLRGANAGVPLEVTERLCQSGDMLLLYRKAEEAVGERQMFAEAVNIAVFAEVRAEAA